MPATATAGSAMQSRSCISFLEVNKVCRKQGFLLGPGKKSAIPKEGSAGNGPFAPEAIPLQLLRSGPSGARARFVVAGCRDLCLRFRAAP